MARNTKQSAAKTDKKLDLETAQQADGALTSSRSAYEICGVKQDRRYQHTTFASYETWLKKADLWELQDHAYTLAVVPSSSRDVMISRLEEAFLRQHPLERAMLTKARAAKVEKETLAEQAARIMAQGR